MVLWILAEITLFPLPRSNVRKPRGIELTSWAGIKGSGHLRIQLSGLRQGYTIAAVGWPVHKWTQTFRAHEKHRNGVMADVQLWEAVGWKKWVHLGQKGEKPFRICSEPA